MNKEEILEKSRSENKNKDFYAEELNTIAATISSFCALILATVFFVIQLIVGQGFNFGLYAICFSVGAVQFIIKAIHLKRKRDVFPAIFYSLVTVTLSCIHIYQLVTSAVH